MKGFYRLKLHVVFYAVKSNLLNERSTGNFSLAHTTRRRCLLYGFPDYGIEQPFNSTESDENMFHIVQNSYFLSMHTKPILLGLMRTNHVGYITLGYEFCTCTIKSPNQNTVFIGCRILLNGYLDMNTTFFLENYMHIQK